MFEPKDKSIFTHKLKSLIPTKLDVEQIIKELIEAIKSVYDLNEEMITTNISGKYKEESNLPKKFREFYNFYFNNTNIKLTSYSWYLKYKQLVNLSSCNPDILFIEIKNAFQCLKVQNLLLPLSNRHLILRPVDYVEKEMYIEAKNHVYYGKNYFEILNWNKRERQVGITPDILAALFYFYQ